jgi:phosphatidylinositol alpha-mannosyltransferase
MKIAFLAPYDFSIPGGVKNHVCGLASNLIEKGHNVSILGVSSQQYLPEVPNFIRLAEFPKARRFSFAPHWRVSPLTAHKLHATLKQERYDLVHIHEPLIPPLCLSTLFCSHTPLFATFHTYYEKGQILYGMFRPIFTKLLQRLQGRITVSQSGLQYINQYFPYDYKVIPNGIDVDKFTRSSDDLRKVGNKDKFQLLFVGHQKFGRKGLKYLLEAYQSLKIEYPFLSLTIVGANWFGADQHQFSIDLAKLDISFLGMVTDAELVSLYQTADIFCAPSIGNESFGIVLLEAMAAGIPIVSTAINGYANVVQHEYNALIVPPKDSHSLAAAIKRVIEYPLLREKLVRQAKATVQQYAWDHITQEILAYYTEKLAIT